MFFKMDYLEPRQGKVTTFMSYICKNFIIMCFHDPNHEIVDTIIPMGNLSSLVNSRRFWYWAIVTKLRLDIAHVTLFL